MEKTRSIPGSGTLSTQRYIEVPFVPHNLPSFLFFPPTYLCQWFVLGRVVGLSVLVVVVDNAETFPLCKRAVQ